MDEKQLKNMWNYFLSLEQDLSNTSRFVDPQGQEDVYSFEFAKIIILGCTEVESAFKVLCKEIDGNNYGDIGQYKSVILTKFPNITEAEVYIPRWNRSFKPFEEWKSGPLSWWSDYGVIKHSRDSHFSNASYKNAAFTLSALYVILLYISEFTGIYIDELQCHYILSPYIHHIFAGKPNKKLPDF